MLVLAMELYTLQWIPLIQGEEQRLRFAGAAVKRYPTPKVRETQVRWYVLQEGIRGGQKEYPLASVNNEVI